MLSSKPKKEKDAFGQQNITHGNESGGELTVPASSSPGEKTSSGSGEQNFAVRYFVIGSVLALPFMALIGISNQNPQVLCILFAGFTLAAYFLYKRSSQAAMGLLWGLLATALLVLFLWVWLARSANIPVLFRSMG